MDLYRVNLNLLIALDTLINEQSVSKAAKKTFITQAAMSNNLKQLREIFKDELLIREKNKMVLTAYATQLQPQLHQLLQQIQTLIVSGQYFEPTKSERIFRVAMSDDIAALMLPKLIASILDKAPNIKIFTVAEHVFSNSEPYENGLYELGIGKINCLSPSISKHLLFKDKIVCLMHKKHPLATKKKISLADYIANKHVSIRSENIFVKSIIEQELEKYQQARDTYLGTSYIIPTLKIIEHCKNLIGTVTNSLAKLYQTNSNYVIKSLPFPTPTIDYYLTWHHRYDNDFGHRWLREQIIKQFKT